MYNEMGLKIICTGHYKHHYDGGCICLCDYDYDIEMGPHMLEKSG